MSTANQPTNPHHRQDTSFVGELQTFTDKPGGLPVDDPQVLARLKKQRGRPKDHRPTKQSSEDQTPTT